MQYVVLAN